MRMQGNAFPHLGAFHMSSAEASQPGLYRGSPAHMNRALNEVQNTNNS
jgi:hypothetical protein